MTIKTNQTKMEKNAQPSSADDGYTTTAEAVVLGEEEMKSRTCLGSAKNWFRRLLGWSDGSEAAQILSAPDGNLGT